MSFKKKLTFLTQANVGKGYKVLRFLLNDNTTKLKIGDRFNIFIPQKQQVEFLTDIKLKNDLILKGSSLDSFLVNDFFIQLDHITSTQDSNEFIDLFVQDSNLNYLKINHKEEILKYFTFSNISEGEEFEYTHQPGEITFSVETRSFSINNYTLLNERKSKTKNNNKINLELKNVKRLGLISEGRGISTMFPIINNYSNRTYKEKLKDLFKRKIGMSLISVYNSSEEICFAEDLFNLNYKSKMFFYPVLRFPPVNFSFGKIMLTSQDIHDYMPNGNDEHGLLLINGSEDFLQNVSGMLESTSFIEGQRLFYYNNI